MIGPVARDGQAPSSQAAAALVRWIGSSTPHSSRAECIDSWGTPTSTVSMPRRVAVIGPIVEPHGMLLRLTNTCHGTPAMIWSKADSHVYYDDYTVNPAP